jgi:hypothetical protein
MSAPEPERAPIAGHSGYAITVATIPPAQHCGPNWIAAIVEELDQVFADGYQAARA